MKMRGAFLPIALAAVLALGAILAPASLNAAGASAVQLLVIPNTITFHLEPPPSTSTCEVTIRVVAPGRAPWRLTVLALGPIRSSKGTRIPASRVSWKGSPGYVFTDGVLSDQHPQLLARGEGSKVFVVRFLLKNTWDLAAGRFTQKLLFNLSSP